MMKQRTENILCVVLACGAIISSLIGLLYSYGGEHFFANNIYGQQVELYGDGIYAYNSILTVSSRLGADCNGIIGAVLLIFLCTLKKQLLWSSIVKTSQVVAFVYYFACLTFSISMNRLYFLYVFCFGLSVILSIHMLAKHFNQLKVIDDVKKNKVYGLSTFLIVSGVIVALIWISILLPFFFNQSYGNLLGVLTTEVTYAVDLGIICPLLVMCGIWIRRKKDIGIKLAPILLFILFSVTPMVILQNLFCIKLGIEVPIQAFIGTIFSFVVIGCIAIVFLVKTFKLLDYKD